MLFKHVWKPVSCSSLYQIETFLIESVDTIISMYGVNGTQTTWSLLDSMQQTVRTYYTLYALLNEA